MAISVGDKLPEATFFTQAEDGPTKVTTADVFAGKKVVLFGVPGAFTGTCSNAHLPGYISHADEILSKGVDLIAVVSVNDNSVMNAWAQSSGSSDKIKFLADGNGDFCEATGLQFDLSMAGMGTRFNRFAMIAEDGTVTHLGVEENPGAHDVSSAETILKAL